MCIRAFERACVWAQRHWTALFESLIGLIGALAAARPRCFTAVRPCCVYFNLFIFGGSETAVLVFSCMQTQCWYYVHQYWCGADEPRTRVYVYFILSVLLVYLYYFFFFGRLDAGCFVVLVSTRVGLFLLVVVGVRQASVFFLTFPVCLQTVVWQCLPCLEST